MPGNALVREAGLKIGPLLLETLVKHYFERILKDDALLKDAPQLRQDELLYDEAFNIIKAFLEASTKHTVEELQAFSNTPTPSPPWVHVVKLLVPMSCCDTAATYLIQVLGGEEMTKRMVGGTKWWQVRGTRGVDAEWIASKKDWQEAKKRYEAFEKGKSSISEIRNPAPSRETSDGGVRQDASAHYQPEMDEMRCVLYAHGGGYYFGSVDQERYSIQRYARKINGRVFAINYRLAPQYPFPCAIQDLLAAYLFLIQPPEGASHRPVNPAHIVVSGDSAGGGLTIALLQILRDVGLPSPAGAVLISPWSDLTHSFPSIHSNTATDVMPPWGLSIYKPSTLWPPPSDDMTSEVQERLRSRIREAIQKRAKGNHSEPVTEPASPNANSPHFDVRLAQSGQTLHLGSTASLPQVDPTVRDQTVTCQTADGRTLTIKDQIHLYAPNYLLTHPLVSPVLSYLGGLPPLFIVASDKEVLRDEIIHLAHKAAYPNKYSVKEEARTMYPPLQGIEQRHGPTKVHLQVYDDAAHVLPILFAFTTPAKYCYRAIATFTKYVTGMIQPAAPDAIGQIPFTTSPIGTPGLSHTLQQDENPNSSSPSVSRTKSFPTLRSKSTARRSGAATPPTSDGDTHGLGIRKSLRRALKARRANSVARPSTESYFTFSRNRAESPARGSPDRDNSKSSDVAGPRFRRSSSPVADGDDHPRKAGELSVYKDGLDTMIRERVSTRGIIRPLEPESELDAFRLPPECIGVVSELAMKRYIEGRNKLDKKFSHAAKTIAKRRRRHLEEARKDAAKNMARFQAYFARGDLAERPDAREDTQFAKDGFLTNGSWIWAWALDSDERPPPSSIVSRRDTSEAVELARIADQAVLMEENTLSGNNLWSLIVNFLTFTPGTHDHEHHHRGGRVRGSKRERFRSWFARFDSENRKDGSSKKSSPVH